jgi:class 3 adenylate cyclase
MQALYLAGRQRDALLAFQRARRTLVDEVGIEPGPVLTDMELRVLSHDADLGPPPGAVAGGPAPRRRRHVTAVCCAAGGVDALADTWDPADTVDLLARFRRAAVRVAADHGGVVVASAASTAPVVTAYFFSAAGGRRGPVDAVLAALAVVAAAAGVRFDGLPGAPPRWGAQVGVDTGPTVSPGAAGPGEDEVPPAGPVLVLADRLRARARPGEVLVTARTAARIRGRVALGAAGDRRQDEDDPSVVGIPVLRAGGSRGPAIP